MPYITQDDRRKIAENGPTNLSEGELNWVITVLVDSWLQEKGVNYKNINAAVGVLECAKQEMYARIARPYEDEKRETNGEVYESIRG